MRLFARAVLGALITALPATVWADNPVPKSGDKPVVKLPKVIDDIFKPDSEKPYKAPKADGPVVELLDETVEPLFPVLDNDGNKDSGTAAREDRDVFAGVEAARVTPSQRFNGKVPGWSFKIVEKPKEAGEFRYIRFAWKKIGGNGIMIQLNDPTKSWGVRYYAGYNVHGWYPALQVSGPIPTEWTVVTRDVYKDFGAFTITGIALTPLNGEAALYDHMLLGRSIEDLDKATDLALGRTKLEKAPDGRERDALWADLMGTNRTKAAAAQRAFLASAGNHVAYIGDNLAKYAPDKKQTERIQQLLKDLDADSFDVRDAATEELAKFGSDAAEAVRGLAARPPSDEVAYRAKLVLKRMNAPGMPVSTTGRTVRAVRVLERAGTREARDLLNRIAEGEFGFGLAADAKAALGRMKVK